MAAARVHRIAQLAGKARKNMSNVNFEQRAFVLSVKESDLSPVKTLKAVFDPFHEKCGSIREITYALSSPKLRQTNPKCDFSVDVKSDLSEPRLEVEFGDGDKLMFKTENLNRVEIVKLFNKICSEKAPTEAQSTGFQTKSTNTKPKPKKK